MGVIDLLFTAQYQKKKEEDTGGTVRVAQPLAAARCVVERNDEYLCKGSRRGLLQAYTKVSK